MTQAVDSADDARLAREAEEQTSAQRGRRLLRVGGIVLLGWGIQGLIFASVQLVFLGQRTSAQTPPSLVQIGVPYVTAAGCVLAGLVIVLRERRSGRRAGALRAGDTTLVPDLSPPVVLLAAGIAGAVLGLACEPGVVGAVDRLRHETASSPWRRSHSGA